MNLVPEWPRITDLIVDQPPADVALIGAPMEAGSVTPGRCDLAPDTVRAALRRFSTYDVETREELAVSINDAGNVAVQGLSPADGFAPIRDALTWLTGIHKLTILIGGNNAVTRPAAHGLGVPIERVGVITLDAHFDLRGTEEGPINGNPIRCLLEDGLPGANLCQIGLSPFANTARMHRTTDEVGSAVFTIAEVKARGIAAVIKDALARVDDCEKIIVDFDIDVLDRSQCPGAPGARPGGMPVDMFFAAARMLAAQPKVALVDLTEFDPSLDVADTTALTAARWVCEVLAGFAKR
jgi:arginase family enzyme